MNKEKINKAIRVAIEAHKGQKRKYNGTPYVLHPFRVAKRLYRAGINDTDILCAALLHDTVEDTHLTLEDIEKDFGNRVKCFVLYSSSKSKLDNIKGVRKERKKIDLEHYLEGPFESMVIKISDALDNCKKIRQENSNFANLYIKEKSEMVVKMYIAAVDAIINENYFQTELIIVSLAKQFLEKHVWT